MPSCKPRSPASRAFCRHKGITKGDRVIIYMPMVPEALIAMLATVRIGAIHSVVFGGFAANELAVRIDDATAQGDPLRLLRDRAGAHHSPTNRCSTAPSNWRNTSPTSPSILQREQLRADLGPNDLDWHDAQHGVTPADCVPVEGNHPAYILYTSGTTGAPKGVIRHTGGHLVALNWTMKNIYNVDPGEVFWAASDVGWVVGHSYICYAPLIHGNTTIVFEGKPVGTPDAGTFWRVIQEHNVRSFFTAPTAFRAIKREDPKGEFLKPYDIVLPARAVIWPANAPTPTRSTGRRTCWSVPVIDHWWQTETGWTIAGNPMGIEPLPVKIGSPSVPMPGYEVHILDETGHEVPDGELGAIAVKLPLPPGTLPGLWNAEERFRKSYLDHFPGYYETGDAGMKDADGYLWIMARTDDVINVAGHRLSTGGMEEVLASHPDVAECAVIGVTDQLKGQLPMGFVCLTKGVNRPHAEIAAECVKLVRDKIGPVAAFKLVAVVDRLPKTRSRQDPARHHGQDRRRRRVQAARDDRRPGDPG